MHGQFFLINRISLLIMCAVAGVLIVGCGESSDSDEGPASAKNSASVENPAVPKSSADAGNVSGDGAKSTGSLTKAQFVDRANAICQEGKDRAKAELSAYLRRNPQAPSPLEDRDQAVELIDTVVEPLYEQRVDRIASLGAPKGDEKEVVAFLNATQRALNASRRRPLRFVTSRNPFAEASRVARAYGLITCAKPLGKE